MNLFDEVLDADWSEVEGPSRSLLRSALTCPIDVPNHLAPPHVALMKHYAQDARTAPQRYVINADLTDCMISAFGTLTYGDIFHLARHKPASSLVLLIETATTVGIVVFDESAIHGPLLAIFLFSRAHRSVIEVAASDVAPGTPYEDAYTHFFLIFHVFCAASMIPRMTVITPVRHGEKLQRARMKRRRAPLVSYNVVQIPLIRRGLHSAKSFLEGLGPRKALHHVQGFVRMIADDTSPIGRRGVFVRDHWRGDPELGVRVKERRL